MELGDLFWAIIWFVIGLSVFSYPPIKNIMEGIGGTISLISLFAVATKPELLPAFIQDIPISYFTGAVTHLVYLIGANIGRANHFGYNINWMRIILYAIALVFIILFLNELKPL